MSHQAENGLPAVFDGLAFASEGATLAGVVAVAALPRLAEGVVDDKTSLDCRVTGSRDGDGKCWLVVEVSGTLDLVCKRCLKKLAFPVEIQTRLLLVPPGQCLPDEELAEDGFDAIAAEKDMALLSLIEDEVLLALPFAPMHEICAMPVPVVDVHESSPFAVLAQLKKGV
jgi:uncharacterized protein